MEPRECRLKAQGFTPGNCTVRVGGHRAPACRATLIEDPKGLRGLVSAVHLSRPENYLSILAFFPAHRRHGYRVPPTSEMIAAYHGAKDAGLRNVRLGNLGMFVRTEDDLELLIRNVPPEDR